MRVTWLCISVLLLASVSGCLSAKVPDVNDAKKGVTDRPVPSLRMIIEIAGEVYEYSTEEAGEVAANSSNTATATANSAAQSANNTANTTGNAAANETDAERANETLQNRHPSGVAPLDSKYNLIVKNAVGVLNWTFTTGDEAPATAGGAAASGSQNATSAGNSTSSQANGTASNANGTAGNASNSANGTAVRAGNTANATFNHTYTMVGNYTPTFTLNMANGAKLELKANVLVAAAEVAKGEVSASAASTVAPGTELGKVTLAKSGTFGAAVQGTNCNAASGLNPVSFTWAWEFPANDTTGTKLVFTKANIVVASQGMTTLDVSLHFLAPDGKVIQSVDAYSADNPGKETIVQAGPFVPGTYNVKVVACASVQGTVTVNGEATMVAA